MNIIMDNACKAATQCWELAEIAPENIDPVLFRAVTCMLAEHLLNCEFYKDQVTLCENYMTGLGTKIDTLRESFAS